MDKLQEEIEALCGERVLFLTAVKGGYTQSVRVIANLEGGKRAFCKAAVDDASKAWINAEIFAYQHITGTFMPELLAHGKYDNLPFILLEDLSTAHWPPPWDVQKINLLKGALDELHGHEIISGLPHVKDYKTDLMGWNEVAKNPEGFLSLGLKDEHWLDKNLSQLIEAESRAPVEGECVLHLDIRSDNACFKAGKALIVDWNWASIGNPDFDLACFLPSAWNEKALPISYDFGIDACFIALISGYWAKVAPEPEPSQDTGIRQMQKAHLTKCLQYLSYNKSWAF